MARLRDRIEKRFEQAARAICRHRVATLLATLVVFVALASGVGKLTIDTSNEAFLHPGDPILTQYIAFKEQFGREDAIIILARPDKLFAADGLDRIRALHDDLAEGVPHLDEVTSLVNARETQGDADRLIVGDLMANRPDSPAEIERLKVRIMENRLYVGQLVSADASATTLVLTLDVYSDAAEASTEDILAGFDDPGGAAAAEPELLTDAETRAAVDAVLAIVAAHEAEDFQLHVAGMPMVTEALKAALKADMAKFMAIAMVTIAATLLVMFQRVAGVVLPMLVVVLSLASTMGLMGHLGVPVTVPTVILPSFLLAVSVGAAVHVLAIFFQQMQAGRDRTEAIAEALGHSGLAIVLTGLTTAAGLGSFATAEVAPIGALGIFAAFGTLVSLVYTIVLLPALLGVVPIRQPHKAQTHSARLDGFLRWTADFATANARTVAGVSLLALLFFLVSAAQLRLTHNVMEWLPRDWPVRAATETIDRDLRGTVVLEMVIDTGAENGLYDRDRLLRIDTLATEVGNFANADLFVGKVFSVVDILKEIHKALNENRPEFYAIPDNADLIPQEFLLFENSGSDDLETVIDSRFQVARVSIRVPWRDALIYSPFLDDITARFETALGPETDVEATGMLSILARTLTAAITSMARSYLVAFAAITVMMMALVGSVRYGALAMLPNLTPIVVVMGGMWWLGLPLNLFTMLVGSIAIGLAVDDTVHFMHNFRRYHDQSGDVQQAVRETLHTTGRAMVTTSIVLGLGFYIFTLATLNNIVHFGLLTGTAIVLALAADFLMLPALLTLTMRKKTEDSK